MTIEALIFDVDGTMADTEEAHRVAFNLAFDRQRLGWTWTRTEYRNLLSVTGGKERIASYIETLPVSPALRQRLLARVPEIMPTRPSSTARQCATAACRCATACFGCWKRRWTPAAASRSPARPRR
jgi:beta-phosphoglucomutase-like phosphatase (HAD superfamily)